ncbi:MAG: nuclear transport factor 2 family protein [Defluviitaleaceae bacterium]|nr:nuclear transport factor 2 family protein [Defluviitaleaceae bacterium]
MSILKPVVTQLEAYNNRDIDGFMANFHEDCVCEDGDGKMLLQGWEAMHISYKNMFENSPNLHCNLVSRTVVGNYVLDEERVTGRAGNDGESHVIAIYKVVDEMIVHVRFLR